MYRRWTILQKGLKTLFKAVFERIQNSITKAQTLRYPKGDAKKA